MLTIFAVPKTFSGHIGTIQTNAIRSWTLLSPQPEIILFGDDKGTAEFAAQLKVRHVPNVARNELGTPLLNDIFQQAARLASHDLLCYVNADIILLSDFVPTIKNVPFRSFLMVGQRWNLDIQELLSFEDQQWEANLRHQVREAGNLEGIAGIDYFIFNRDLSWEIPPMAIGRLWWDDWFLFRARFLGIPLIDATEAITIIHQNHDYGHHPQERDGVWKGAEMQRNLELAGGYEHVFSLEDADYLASGEGFHKPKWNRKRLLRYLHVQAVIDPNHTKWIRFKKMLFARRRWSDYNQSDYYKKRLHQLFDFLWRLFQHPASQRPPQSVK